MAVLLSRKGAALVVALFSFSALADEYSEYLALKSALVRSSSGRDRAIPSWLVVPDTPKISPPVDSVSFPVPVDRRRVHVRDVLCPLVVDGRVIGGKSCD